MSRRLPDFVKPMLARNGRPFDSEEHLFEIKWDGLRTSVYVEQGAYRLRSRQGNDMTVRYPEFDALAQLPSGTILDGELVVLNAQGKPDFRAALRRQQARSTLRIQQAARVSPATLILFDQLYADYRSIQAETLEVRRRQMLETLDGVGVTRLIASEGVVGPGKQYFAQAVARELEGVVAKRLDSRYQPGKRNDDWIKIRKRSSVLCAIIGYVPKGDDFESLILATDHDGELQYVGRVGSGFDETLRARLNAVLRQSHSGKSLVPCPDQGQWLQPGLYCSVAYLEKTEAGVLREPVFERIVEGD